MKKIIFLVILSVFILNIQTELVQCCDKHGPSGCKIMQKAECKGKRYPLLDPTQLVCDAGLVCPILRVPCCHRQSAGKQICSMLTRAKCQSIGGTESGSGNINGGPVPSCRNAC